MKIMGTSPRDDELKVTIFESMIVKLTIVRTSVRTPHALHSRPKLTRAVTQEAQDASQTVVKPLTPPCTGIAKDTEVYTLSPERFTGTIVGLVSESSKVVFKALSNIEPAEQTSFISERTAVRMLFHNDLFVCHVMTSQSLPCA